LAVIGTAGHVDHGKSTLVQALTGIDPDRLREEKERGLTIDLGFAWLELPSGRDVGIVDVPGHERFIKNMLAGAGGMDLALLVVAADEGPRPQTAEHLAILDLLEVPAGIVVITKCDLAEPDYIDLVEAELEDTLKGSPLQGARVVRVSAAAQTGLDELRAAIDEALDAAPAKRDLGRPRLAIDRAFTIQGFGAVVTGTLIDGALTAGQEVELQPGGQRARIRGLQRHKTKVERLDPGSRAAVNLSGVRTEDIRRGMVLAGPGAAQAVSVIDTRLRASRILTHPLSHEAIVTALCATAESQAKVRLLDADTLSRGQECWAQLVLDSPIVVLPGDHVVLRTPNETVAGGKVIAVSSRRHRRNHAPTIEALERQLAGSPASRLLDALLAGPATSPELRKHLGFDDATLAGAVVELTASGQVVDRAGYFVASSWLESRSLALLALAGEFFAANALRRSVPREHLRGRLRLSPAAFDLLTAEMAQAGTLETRGAGVAPKDFEPTLSERDRRTIDAFLAEIKAGGHSPPTESLPPPPVLSYLVERGAVVDTSAGVVFDSDVFAQMVERTREHIAVNGSVSLAEARDLFGNSRKYAQAFLEHLDALHITRRSGDTRTLR
jgi:selenocysteine-specific elongation factor